MPSWCFHYNLLRSCVTLQIVVAGNTFVYITFFFCIGRRKFQTSYLLCQFRLAFCHGCTVYTNSLLATLNARKMIRNGDDSTQNSTSLRDFPRKRSRVAKVELMDFNTLRFLDLWRFLQQPASISININTTQASVTDQDQYTDKADVCSSRFFYLGEIC